MEDKINEIKEESMKKEEFWKRKNANLKENIKAVEEKMITLQNKKKQWVSNEDSCTKKMTSHKEEANRLKKEIVKSKEKTHECGKEIVLLKKYSTKVEEFKQQRQRKKVQNSRRDS